MPRLPRAVFAGFAHHVTQRRNRRDSVIRPGSPWQQQLTAVTDWSAWLAQTDDDNNALNTLGLHANEGLPCGDSGFVVRLSDMVGRSLVPKPRGRPKLELEEKGGVRFFPFSFEMIPMIALKSPGAKP